MAVTSGIEPLAGALGSAELFRRWRAERDRRARDVLIERFLPLARKLARRYTASNEPYDDLVQVASLGLVKAVERFDPERGFAFTSFAGPTIVGELKRYFRDTAWALHVDRSAQEWARRIADARGEIATRLRGLPGLDPIRMSCGLRAGRRPGPEHARHDAGRGPITSAQSLECLSPASARVRA